MVHTASDRSSNLDRYRLPVDFSDEIDPVRERLGRSGPWAWSSGSRLHRAPRPRPRSFNSKQRYIGYTFISESNRR